MIKDINLSQVLALIAVSGSVKQIRLTGGNLAWKDRAGIDITQTSYSAILSWKRSEFCGSERQELCMQLRDLRKPYPWENHKDDRFYEPVLRAYHYQGDNCNSSTKFLYEIIGNEIEIIDDIGLVGNGGAYSRKNLLKIDPNEIYKQKVRSEGLWAEDKGGA